jgi:hypothetical protein
MGSRCVAERRGGHVHRHWGGASLGTSPPLEAGPRLEGPFIIPRGLTVAEAAALQKTFADCF